MHSAPDRATDSQTDFQILLGGGGGGAKNSGGGSEGRRRASCSSGVAAQSLVGDRVGVKRRS